MARTNVFISYAQVDGADYARRLHQDLERAGIQAFFDEQDIKEGQNIEVLVRAHLMTARAILAVLTPGALDSNYVTGELFRALDDDVPIIPLVFADGAMPTSLGAIKYLDFQRDYDAAFARLLERLATIQDDHLEYQRLKLNDLIEQQAASPSPERLQTKIDRLRVHIASWSGALPATPSDEGGTLPSIHVDSSTGAKARHTAPRVVGVPLPDIATDFRNRQAPLRRLRELLADPAIRAITVLGRGGVGKSALIAHTLRDEPPSTVPPLKGVVCLSAKAEHELNAEEVFLAFGELLDERRSARLTQAWSRPSVDMAAKADALLRELRDGTYVLVLDNVETALDAKRQFQDKDLHRLIEACIGTENTLVLLLTSRVPVAFRKELLAYDQQIELTAGLPTPDGVEMLRALDASGRSGLRELPSPTLATLVGTVRGLPRALELVAYLLASDPLLPVTDLLDSRKFFQTTDVLNELVVGAYSRVDRDALQVLQALAVFGRFVPQAAVEFLLEPFASAATVSQTLRFLVQSYVVSSHRASGTVGLHPLDRDYALATIPTVGEYRIVALHRRAADYYARVRKPEAQWTSPNHLRPQLFEFRHRLQAGDYDLATELLSTIDENYLEVWGYNRRLVSMRRELAGETLPCGLQLQNLVRLARAEHRLGEFQTAIATNGRAQAIAIEMGDRQMEATCLNYIGINCHFIGDYQRAIDSHTAALEKAAGDPRREAACLNALGNAYNQIGDYDRSREMHEQALALRAALDNRRWLSDSLQNRGELQVNLGLLSAALDDFTSPLPATRGGGRWSDDLPRLTNSSLVLIEYGDFDAARQQLTRALALTRRTLEWRWEDMQRGLLADIERLTGSYDRAVESYRTAIEVATAMGSRHKRTRHVVGLAMVARLRDQYDESAAEAAKALEEAKRLSDATQLARAATEMAFDLLLMNDIRQARRIGTESLAIVVPLHHHRLLLVNGLVATQDGDGETAAEFFDQACTAASALLASSPRCMAASVTRSVAAHALSIVRPASDSRLATAPAITSADGVFNEAAGVAKDVQQLLAVFTSSQLS